MLRKRIVIVSLVFSLVSCMALSGCRNWVAEGTSAEEETKEVMDESVDYVAEYQRQEKEITFVDIPFDGELMILGDGKALCRVFENLLNNISKYALPGSRAYIEVKKTDANIIISFKNVSAEQIHLSGDELTERFVRGDASRHSEGHGLGLSIVKSLMDLMNGGPVISAEYDMFVVELVFQEYILP